MTEIIAILQWVLSSEGPSTNYAERAADCKLARPGRRNRGDDGHWARGCYDDGNGGHCLVGALLHLSRKHRLPTAPTIALLQDAMPRPGLPLVHFNDTRCGGVAELRSVILKARRLAHADAERHRAAAAVKAWLLAQTEKKRAAPAADSVVKVPVEPFAPERLAA